MSDEGTDVQAAFFAYRLQVRHACEDLDVLRRRLRELEHDIERFLKEHEVGSLLTTIDGIGVQTSARLIAERGGALTTSG